VHLTAAVSRNYQEETEPPRVSLTSSSGRREERIIELCEGMMDITAALFNVSSKELRSPGRGGLGVSRVRHIAMYVTHVALSVTMRDVGAGFGRDRTTVMYACHLVEDLRDDADFDRMVALTERVALAAFGNKASF
jgi:chromosomal replication initiation ATPase DnaA